MTNREPISPFIRFLLRRICRMLVVQGAHRERIIAYYRIMHEAAAAEFREDNQPTLNSFLSECYQEAQIR